MKDNFTGLRTIDLSTFRFSFGGRNVSRALAALALLASFWVCLWMYTRHNTYPYQYHPDEASKAQQVLSADGDRNFNHPQLLLELTQWATWWQNTIPQAQANHQSQTQAVVEVGRTVSAVLAALGVVALALCGYLTAGWPGLIAVTPVVALCPFLLAHAHSMKEDASLVFGVGLAVLGSRLVWTWGRRSHLVWVGIVVLACGCAAAASGKFVGAATVALAILTLIFAPKRSWTMASLWPLPFFSYAILLFLVINHRGIEFWDGSLEGFEREYHHAISDHQGLTMAQPNSYVLDVTFRQTFPHVLVAAGIGLLLVLFWWRGKLGWDRILWIFTGGFLLMLSYGVIPMPRYSLPIVVLVATLAGLAAARLGQFINHRWAVWGVPILFATATIALQAPRCADYIDQTAHDSRQALRDFLKRPEMRNANVLADVYAKIDAPPYNGVNDNLHIRHLTRTSAGELGPLARVRQMGFDYVIVASTTYDRYFDPHVFPIKEYRRQYNQRRGFYEELFKKGTLVWSRKPEHPTGEFTNPEIRVYKIGD